MSISKRLILHFTFSLRIVHVGAYYSKSVWQMTIWANQDNSSMACVSGIYCLNTAVSHSHSYLISFSLGLFYIPLHFWYIVPPPFLYKKANLRKLYIVSHLLIFFSNIIFFRIWFFIKKFKYLINKLKNNLLNILFAVLKNAI